MKVDLFRITHITVIVCTLFYLDFQVVVFEGLHEKLCKKRTSFCIFFFLLIFFKMRLCVDTLTHVTRTKLILIAVFPVWQIPARGNKRSPRRCTSFPPASKIYEPVSSVADFPGDAVFQWIIMSFFFVCPLCHRRGYKVEARQQGGGKREHAVL